MKVTMFFTKEQAEAMQIGGEGWYCFDPNNFEKVEGRYLDAEIIEGQDPKAFVWIDLGRKRKKAK